MLYQNYFTCLLFENRKRHGPEHSRYVLMVEQLTRLLESSTRSGDSNRITSPFEDVGRRFLILLSCLDDEVELLSGVMEVRVEPRTASVVFGAIIKSLDIYSNICISHYLFIMACNDYQRSNESLIQNVASDFFNIDSNDIGLCNDYCRKRNTG